MGSPAIDFQPEEQLVDFQPEESIPPPVPRPVVNMQEQPLAPTRTDLVGAFKSALLLPAERTGTHYVAAPNQATPQERLGEMVPQAAVPSLAAAKKYAVDPFEKTAAAGGKAGGDILEGTAMRAIQPFAAPELANQPAAPSAPDPMTEMRKRFPITSGVTRGAGEMIGSTAADPRSWPFFASGAARPILQKIISRGFAANVSANAINAAKELHDNWDNLTPAQRAQKGTEAGVGALIIGAALHPKLNIGSTPEVTAGTADILGGKVRAGVAVTPEAVTFAGNVGSKVGRYSIPRTPKTVPAPQPALEPPTIEGQAGPFTREEIAAAQEATNYAGPREAESAAIQARAQAAASKTPKVPVASQGGREPAVVTPPAAAVAPKPKPFVPARIDFQPEGEILPPERGPSLEQVPYKGDDSPLKTIEHNAPARSGQEQQAELRRNYGLDKLVGKTTVVQESAPSTELEQPATSDALTKSPKSIDQHIWDTVEKKGLVIYGSWTDEGLRKDFDIPQAASLRKMEEAGIIQKNTEGLLGAWIAPDWEQCEAEVQARLNPSQHPRRQRSS
jgi:hypothetical protein